MNEATLGSVYELLNDYMEMGLEPMRAFVEPGSEAPPPFAVAAALGGIRSPTLFLSAEREPLQASFERAAALVPGSRRHRFPGTHPLVTPERGRDYATAILDHIRST